MSTTSPELVGPWVDVPSFAPAGVPRDGKTRWDTYLGTPTSSRRWTTS
jgi:hypothetical protein